MFGFDDIMRALVGRQVRVIVGEETHTGELRGVWRDAVPYFPDVPTPALWLTTRGGWEDFVPIADIHTLETA